MGVLLTSAPWLALRAADKLAPCTYEFEGGSGDDGVATSDGILLRSSLPFPVEYDNVVFRMGLRDMEAVAPANAFRESISGLGRPRLATDGSLEDVPCESLCDDLTGLWLRCMPYKPARVGLAFVEAARAAISEAVR